MNSTFEAVAWVTHHGKVNGNCVYEDKKSGQYCIGYPSQAEANCTWYFLEIRDSLIRIWEKAFCPKEGEQWIVKRWTDVRVFIELNKPRSKRSP